MLASQAVWLGVQVDWKSEGNQPVEPAHTGTTVYTDFPLEDVVDYIDWNPFFQVCSQILPSCVTLGCGCGANWQCTHMCELRCIVGLQQ